MSNPENFINEVTEEVRRDRLFHLVRRYAWVAVLLIVGAVGYAGWSEWRRAAGQETAEQFGDALTLALESPAPEARAASLSGIAGAESGRRAAVAGLLAAQGQFEAGDRAAAVARLAAVAEDGTLPPAWRDLARLRQVTLAGPDMPMADRQAALDALARPGSPYRALALEQSAILTVERGETAAAAAALRALQQEPDVTAGQRRRVMQLLMALGAAPEAG